MSSEHTEKIEYREHPNYSGYFAGSDGRAYSSKNRSGQPIEIRTRVRRRYLSFTISNNGAAFDAPVHRFVLECFVGACPEGHEARHLDGNGTNNRPDNLRWGTKKENAADRKRHGTEPLGEKHGMSILRATDVVEIRKLLAAGASHRNIAKKFGVTIGAIGCISRGKTWKHIPA